MLNALEVPPPLAKFTYPYNNLMRTTISLRPHLSATGHSVRRQWSDAEHLASMLRNFCLTLECITPIRYRSTISAAGCCILWATKDRYIVVNFSRVKLAQEGGGHFSPLAAYDGRAIVSC